MLRPSLAALLAILTLAGCDQARPVSQAQVKPDDTAQEQSFLKGPRFELTKPVGDGEEVSILLLPDRDIGAMDQRCLIYKNEKIGAVAVHCPNNFEPPVYDQENGDTGCSSGGRFGDC